MAYKFNLFRLFSVKEEPNLRKTYKRLITLKKGIRNDRAPKNHPNTVRTKGKDHWGVDTGETRSDMFDRKIGKLWFSLFAKDEPHSGKYTYVNSEGRKEIKQRSKSSKIRTYQEIQEFINQKNYSGIFGDALPVASKMPDRIGDEIFRQMVPQLERKLKKEFRDINRRMKRR